MIPPALLDPPSEPSAEEKPTPKKFVYAQPFDPQTHSECHRKIFLDMMEFNERNGT
jgi:hypothetical protein